ncbi:MAG TPA: tetratricopeptide repeat-containing serine protease family protein [Pyrinomonadaceae bacterium]|nr:tetratricopeptide repeat-containing serine protease family protein [Pyrinomonadaceae bacterium]
MRKRTSPRPFVASLVLLSTLCLAAEAGVAQESLPDLVRRLKPAVVAIVTYDASGEALTTGSGFFIRPGQVVTNLHVMRGARRSEIRTLDGKGRVHQVEGVLAIDEEGDLALLSVPTPPERARSSELSPTLPDEGERVFVIGNPLKLEGSVSDGIVSAVREVPGVGRIIQTTAPISHGNSGSPIFNLKGRVVGVITVKVTNGQNINLAIGSTRVKELNAGKLRPLSDLPAKDKINDMGEALYRTGLESLWLGNYDHAVGYFENAANRNPKRADAWIQVGYCKVKQGKTEEAIKAYQQALQLKPESEEILNKLGDAYYYAGRMEEAIGSYKEAARLNPGSAEAYYNLALVYFETGDHKLAATQANILQQLDRKLYEKFLSETNKSQ